MDCAWAGVNVEIQQQICRDMIKLIIHIKEVFVNIFYLCKVVALKKAVSVSLIY